EWASWFTERMAGHATHLLHYFHNLGRVDNCFGSAALRSDVADIQSRAKNRGRDPIESLRPRADAFARLLYRRQDRRPHAARPERIAKRTKAHYPGITYTDSRHRGPDQRALLSIRHELADDPRSVCARTCSFRAVPLHHGQAAEISRRNDD